MSRWRIGGKSQCWGVQRGKKRRQNSCWRGMGERRRHVCLEWGGRSRDFWKLRVKTLGWGDVWRFEGERDNSCGRSQQVRTGNSWDTYWVDESTGGREWGPWDWGVQGRPPGPDFGDFMHTYRIKLVSGQVRLLHSYSVCPTFPLFPPFFFFFLIIYGTPLVVQ